MELTGAPLIRRVEGIRAHHRLNPPDAPVLLGATSEVIRVVCGDGPR